MVPEVFHNLSVESKHHRQTWLPNPINRTLESENSHQHTGTSSLLLSCTSPEISLPPSSLGYHWNGKHKTSFMDRVLPYLITEALRSYLLFSKTNSKPTRQKVRHCKDRLFEGNGRRVSVSTPSFWSHFQTTNALSSADWCLCNKCWLKREEGGFLCESYLSKIRTLVQ